MGSLPIYKIDLDLPPKARYLQPARDYAHQLQALAPLFEEVVKESFPLLPFGVTKAISKRVLRKVWSHEETEELRGIATAIDVPLYLLVAFNTFLDSFMGCTSGAVKGLLEKEAESQMIHFRTLDWAMPELRGLLVCYEYFSKATNSNPSAKVITYAGYQGCLTGVRKGMSISLNFRPSHSCSTFSLITHQISVMLGFRPSVAALLREIIVQEPCPTITSLAQSFSQRVSAPCYVVFCDGNDAYVVEKDLKEAHVRSSSSLIVHTNHDSPATATCNEGTKRRFARPLQAFLDDSRDRQSCVMAKYKHFLESHPSRLSSMNDTSPNPPVPVEILVRWLLEYPTSNEQTHFSCILDPKAGRIIRVYV